MKQSLRSSGTPRRIVSRSLRRPPLAHESIHSFGLRRSKLVPVGQVTGDVSDLGDALPILGVRAAPVAQRVDVEVLTIDVDAFAHDQAVDAIDDPLPGVAVAEIHQPAVLATVDPLGMILGQPGVRSRPLGLEPQHELHAIGMGKIGDLANPFRKSLFVDFPSSGVGPANRACWDTSRHR